MGAVTTTTTAGAAVAYRVVAAGGGWRLEAVVRRRPGGTGLARYRHYHRFATAAGAAGLLARVRAIGGDPVTSPHWSEVP